MSLDARNMTQGGQVIKYMVAMFMQIANIVAFWVILATILVFFATIAFQIPFEKMIHGLAYWAMDTLVIPLQEAIGTSEGGTFTFHWLNPRTGQVVEFEKTAREVRIDRYFIHCYVLLKDAAFWAWGVASFTFVGLIVAVFWWLGKKGAQQRKNEIIGGRYLANSVKEINQFLKANGKLSSLKIGDLHLVENSEQQNIGLHGTVGTGKSTVINDLLSQVRKQGKRAIIYDKGNNFIPLFYREGKDIILNPMDARCPNWDLWRECQDRADFETFALPLFPDAKSGDPFWLMSARLLFVATAEHMRSHPDRSIKKLLQRLLSISLAELHDFVQGTDAANLVDGSIEKTAMTIRTVLSAYVKALRYCQGLEKEGKPPFSIREWVQNADEDAWIFISSDGRLHAALKPLISTWLNITMQSVLALTPSRERRIWTVLDELPSLHKLPVILDYLSEARKFGGATLIGIQNFSQLEANYGAQEARAIWDLVNTTLYFRAPSGSVAEWVQKELGETRLLKFRDQYSYGVDTIRDGVNFSKEDTREKIVSFSDIQNLDDLQCFVSLLGDVPIVKLTLEHKQYQTIAAGKIERDVSAIFDNQIEQELNKSGIENKVNKLVTGRRTQSDQNNQNQTNNPQTMEITPPEPVHYIETVNYGGIKATEPVSVVKSNDVIENIQETNINLRKNQTTEKEI
ncbi:MAG: type IV conjugative transfer system coupling protein TraD [Arsenophonus sp.]|uniref:type IV conjugative transfer system coupling protein TraD n=2 Tax=Arsenophonus sp. TaxID=1872640 RepID=UPI00285A0092|nr:type IV conjugative transfer system coupling protein TraD [Arsenophonus sp.]MDR5610323.1 type IV conjugative transfer system coupling protein TraD [Arsenophonus sp.]